MYILAVSLPPSLFLSQDLCATLLPLLSPSILRGLQDVDDDVRAVAASSLLPVADQLMTIMPGQVGSHSPVYLTFTFNMCMEAAGRRTHSVVLNSLTHFLLFPSPHRSHSFWPFCGPLWLILMTSRPPPEAFWAFSAHCSPRTHNSTLVGHPHPH